MIKFRTTCTLCIIANFFLLTLLPCNSFAQIGYISLHDVESTSSQTLSVKLNIVETKPKLPLKFILANQQTRTTLTSTRINDYMLRLKGPRKISGRAVIHVYQFERDAWRRVKGINISDSLKSFNVPAKAKSAKAAETKPEAAQVSTQSKQTTTAKTTVKVTPATREKITASAKIALATKAVKSQVDCTLTRQLKETLWSIASRYKEQWQVDVFSAMIAIYKSNTTKFSKQHIARLMDHYVLQCPSKRMLNAMGTKAQMKAEFNRLNALPLNNN